jgi:hypothetical protein
VREIDFEIPRNGENRSSVQSSAVGMNKTAKGSPTANICVAVIDSNPPVFYQQQSQQQQDRK